MADLGPDDPARAERRRVRRDDVVVGCSGLAARCRSAALVDVVMVGALHDRRRPGRVLRLGRLQA